VGLSWLVCAILSAISLLPLVGLVIGFYYSRQRNYATRSFGRMLFGFAVLLHFMYLCVLCPTLAYFGLQQL
jgi:hypothetical protein